jgi:hypothetical protein
MEGLQWRVENGSQIHIWVDKWLPHNRELGKLRQRVEIDKEVLVEELIEWQTNRLQ